MIQLEASSRDEAKKRTNLLHPRCIHNVLTKKAFHVVTVGINAPGSGRAQVEWSSRPPSASPHAPRTLYFAGRYACYDARSSLSLACQTTKERFELRKCDRDVQKASGRFAAGPMIAASPDPFISLARRQRQRQTRQNCRVAVPDATSSGGWCGLRAAVKQKRQGKKEIWIVWNLELVRRAAELCSIRFFIRERRACRADRSMLVRPLHQATLLRSNEQKKVFYSFIF